MKRAFKYIAAMDMIFVLILALSGLFSGKLSQIIYYLAFVIPLWLAFLVNKRSDVEFCVLNLKIAPKKLVLVIPAVAPTVALIFLISWISSFLISLTGYENTVTDVSGNIIVLIASYAVITALLEEMLFRYVPIALLRPHSRRGAVLVSALLFAILHFNPYQIPYAFLAGVVFAAIDIAFDSIWPSIILHFVNNAVSVFWIKYSSNDTFVTVYITLLAALSLISIGFIFVLRNKYRKELSIIQ